MEENNNSFLSISQVIKQLDNEYTDTEETRDSLYNSNYICEYEKEGLDNVIYYIKSFIDVFIYFIYE